MSNKQLDNIVMENVRVIFKNFAGAESPYNRKGCRNFCAVIDDPDTAQKLSEDGWNVRMLAPRDEDEEATYYLSVAVGCNKDDGRLQPKVVRIVGSDRKTPVKNAMLELNEDTIYILDSDQIKSADLVIRPYNWEVNGKTGVKAYLKTGYFVVEEDEFADKYSVYEDDTPPF